MNMVGYGQLARNGAAYHVVGSAIFYASSLCPTGEVLVARTSGGVCAILLGDSASALEAELAALFLGRTLVAADDAVRDDMARVARFMEEPAVGLSLSLDLRGTPFQRRVWTQIRMISVGRTISYTDLAHWVGPLTSPRAVASACAANLVALAVPCHRVVGSHRESTDYRWGVERKLRLIEKEAGRRRSIAPPRFQ